MPRLAQCGLCASTASSARVCIASPDVRRSTFDARQPTNEATQRPAHARARVCARSSVCVRHAFSDVSTLDVASARRRRRNQTAALVTHRRRRISDLGRAASAPSATSSSSNNNNYSRACIALARTCTESQWRSRSNERQHLRDDGPHAHTGLARLAHAHLRRRIVSCLSRCAPHAEKRARTYPAACVAADAHFDTFVLDDASQRQCLVGQRPCNPMPTKLSLLSSRALAASMYTCARQRLAHELFKNRLAHCLASPGPQHSSASENASTRQA